MKKKEAKELTIEYESWDNAPDRPDDKIIELLGKQPMDIKSLADELNFSESYASRVLKRLFDDGLIMRKKIGKTLYYGMAKNLRK